MRYRCMPRWTGVERCCERLRGSTYDHAANLHCGRSPATDHYANSDRHATAHLQRISAPAGLDDEPSYVRTQHQHHQHAAATGAARL